jgi:hemerythrin-like metal-binding protein
VEIKLVGELLVEEGAVTADQLAEAVALQKENGKLLGEILIDRGWVTPKQLVAVLSKQVYSYNYLIDKVISANTPKDEVPKIDLKYFERNRHELVLSTKANWERLHLSTGITIVDIQHIWLIMLSHYAALIFRTIDTRQKLHEIKNIIELLIDYSKEHFRVEESLLRAAHDHSSHAHQHEEFVRFIVAKKERLLQDIQHNTSNSNALLNEMCEYLNEWILSHIAIHDKAWALTLAKLPAKREVMLAWIDEMKRDKLTVITKVQNDLYNEVIK